MHDAAIVGFREELLDALVFDRMAQGGSDFRERHQNEAPLIHPRMRNFELLSANDTGAIKQYIQIDDARASAHGVLAAEFIFDFLEGSQQLARHQIGFNFQDTVQKPGLGGDVDRFGRINRGLPYDANASRTEGLNGRGDLLFTVTNI